jgi:hypothetical protein
LRPRTDRIAGSNPRANFWGVRFLSCWPSGVEFTRAKLVCQRGFLPGNDFEGTLNAYFGCRIAKLSLLIVFGLIPRPDRFLAPGLVSVAGGWFEHRRKSQIAKFVIRHPGPPRWFIGFCTSCVSIHHQTTREYEPDEKRQWRSPAEVSGAKA